MSNVENSVQLIKLASDAVVFVETAVSNKGNVQADLPEGLALISEVISDIPLFSAAVLELKALDVAGVESLVNSILSQPAVSSLGVSSAKVQSAIAFLLQIEPAVNALLAAFGVASVAAASSSASPVLASTSAK